MRLTALTTLSFTVCTQGTDWVVQADTLTVFLTKNRILSISVSSEVSASRLICASPQGPSRNLSTLTTHITFQVDLKCSLEIVGAYVYMGLPTLALAIAR